MARARPRRTRRSKKADKESPAGSANNSDEEETNNNNEGEDPEEGKSSRPTRRSRRARKATVKAPPISKPPVDERESVHSDPDATIHTNADNDSDADHYHDSPSEENDSESEDDSQPIIKMAKGGAAASNKKGKKKEKAKAIPPAPTGRRAPRRRSRTQLGADDDEIDKAATAATFTTNAKRPTRKRRRGGKTSDDEFEPATKGTSVKRQRLPRGRGGPRESEDEKADSTNEAEASDHSGEDGKVRKRMDAPGRGAEEDPNNVGLNAEDDAAESDEDATASKRTKTRGPKGKAGNSKTVDQSENGYDVNSESKPGSENLSTIDEVDEDTAQDDQAAGNEPVAHKDRKQQTPTEMRPQLKDEGEQSEDHDQTPEDVDRQIEQACAEPVHEGNEAWDTTRKALKLKGGAGKGRGDENKDINSDEPREDVHSYAAGERDQEEHVGNVSLTRNSAVGGAKRAVNELELDAFAKENPRDYKGIENIDDREVDVTKGAGISIEPTDDRTTLDKTEQPDEGGRPTKVPRGPSSSDVIEAMEAPVETKIESKWIETSAHTADEDANTGIVASAASVDRLMKVRSNEDQDEGDAPGDGKESASERDTVGKSETNTDATIGHGEGHEGSRGDLKDEDEHDHNDDDEAFKDDTAHKHMRRVSSRGVNEETAENTYGGQQSPKIDSSGNKGGTGQNSVDDVSSTASTGNQMPQCDTSGSKVRGEKNVKKPISTSRESAEGPCELEGNLRSKGDPPDHGQHETDQAADEEQNLEIQDTDSFQTSPKQAELDPQGAIDRKNSSTRSNLSKCEVEEQAQKLLAVVETSKQNEPFAREKVSMLDLYARSNNPSKAVRSTKGLISQYENPSVVSQTEKLSASSKGGNYVPKPGGLKADPVAAKFYKTSRTVGIVSASNVGDDFVESSLEEFEPTTERTATNARVVEVAPPLQRNGVVEGLKTSTTVPKVTREDTPKLSKSKVALVSTVMDIAPFNKVSHAVHAADAKHDDHFLPEYEEVNVTQKKEAEMASAIPPAEADSSPDVAKAEKIALSPLQAEEAAQSQSKVEEDPKTILITEEAASASESPAEESGPASPTKANGGKQAAAKAYGTVPPQSKAEVGNLEASKGDEDDASPVTAKAEGGDCEETGSSVAKAEEELSPDATAEEADPPSRVGADAKAQSNAEVANLRTVKAEAPVAPMPEVMEDNQDLLTVDRFFIQASASANSNSTNRPRDGTDDAPRSRAEDVHSEPKCEEGAVGQNVEHVSATSTLEALTKRDEYASRLPKLERADDGGNRIDVGGTNVEVEHFIRNPAPTGSVALIAKVVDVIKVGSTNEETEVDHITSGFTAAGRSKALNKHESETEPLEGQAEDHRKAVETTQALPQGNDRNMIGDAGKGNVTEVGVNRHTSPTDSNTATLSQSAMEFDEENAVLGRLEQMEIEEINVSEKKRLRETIDDSPPQGGPQQKKARGDGEEKQNAEMNEINPASQNNSGSGALQENQYREIKRCDIDKIKMLLFSAGSITHRGRGFERLFSEYWGALSLIIGGEETGDKLMKLRLVVKSFLKTKRLRRLHNKLMIALIDRSLQETVPLGEIAGYIPTTCRGRVKAITRRPSPGAEPEAKSDPFSLDPCEKLRAETEEAQAAAHDVLLPAVSLKGASVLDPLADNRTLIYTPLFYDKNAQTAKAPDTRGSCRLPGALTVDPFIREVVQSEGMKVSEHAVWLVVVAIKEHTKSLVEKVIQLKEACRQNRICQPSHSAEVLCRRNRIVSDSKKASADSEKKGKLQANLGLEQNEVISVSDFTLLAANMRMGAVDSLGGTISRVAYERCIFASAETNETMGGNSLHEIHDFLISGIEAASVEIQKLPKNIKHASSTKLSGPTKLTTLGEISSQTDQTAKAADFIVPQPSVKPNLAAAVDRRTVTRSPVQVLGRGGGRGGKNLGLGRGAKNLAALMARTTVATAAGPCNPAVATVTPATAETQALALDKAPSPAAMQAPAPTVAQNTDPVVAQSLDGPPNGQTGTNDATDSASVVAASEMKGSPNQVVRRGRGLGKKNLAFMRARVVTDKPETSTDASTTASSPGHTVEASSAGNNET